MTGSISTYRGRTSGRHDVDLAAAIRVPGAKVRAQICRLRNLSLGGTFIELERLAMGTRVNITFGLPRVSERLSLEAVVTWANDDGVGVQFVGLRAWEMWVLWSYLDSVSAQGVLAGLDPECAENDAHLDAPTVVDRMPAVEDDTQVVDLAQAVGDDTQVIDLLPNIEHDTQAERRDVYARYGLAMNCAHALERSIAHVMIMARQPEPITSADIDAILGRDHRRALQHLLRSMAWHVALQPTLEALLDAALAARSWLAHECFRENAEQLHSHEGRAAMLGSFIDVTELLRRADDELREHMRPIREIAGIADEELDRIRGALLAARSAGERPAARARDSSGRI
jgi:PilZ domain